MPGRATPSTVFCAEARRGVPAVPAGGTAASGPCGGGGGGDGNVDGGAMPNIVEPKWRAGGWLALVVGGGWLAACGGVEPVVVAGAPAAAGGVNVGGAMPIMVPRRLGAGLAGSGLAGSGLAGSGLVGSGLAGSGGDMTMVPPKPWAASGKAMPQPVQTVCWSKFCVPQRPHCFI